MDRQNSNPNITTPPDLSVRDIDKAKLLVQETLGHNFSLAANLPRNVGIKGDGGIWGETVLITAHNYEDLQALFGDQERLARFSTLLGNEFYSLTRVLIDISAQDSLSTLETPNAEPLS